MDVVGADGTTETKKHKRKDVTAVVGFSDFKDAIIS